MARPIERDGSFYHRARVPRDIVATFAQTRSGKPMEELWLPLGRTPAEARRNLPNAMVEAQERFDAHRKAVGGNVVRLLPRTPTKPALAVAGSGERFYSVREAVEFYALGIDQIECHMRADETAKALADPEAFWRGEIIKLAPNVNREMGIGPALAACYRDRMARKLAMFRDAMEIMDLSVAGMFVTAVFPGCENRLLMIECARAEIDYMESKLKRPGSVLYELPAEPEPATRAAGPLLSVAVEKWKPIKQREGWTVARMQLLDTAVALLAEVCGDKAIGSYGKSDVAELRDVLARLPRHRFKNPKTKNLTARAAADLGLPPIDLKTANDYIAILIQLWTWAKLTFDDVDENPFEAAKFARHSDQREEGTPFELDELKAIFAGLARADDAKFWAPILGLYTGGRSQELLKLKVADIRREEETGLWYFDINEDTHSDPKVHHTLKRRSHARRVPVHADLVAFGFLEFVKRSKGERLFPELRYNTAGKFSGPFGRWFARYLDQIGVKRAKAVFHSFRHNFVDACDGRMPDDIITRLKGDARGGTLDRYGKGKTEVEILAEHLANMKVKGLDLTHLRLPTT